jgi:mRNA interferase RelE/StbE
MPWRVEFATLALREFKALDRVVQRRIATHIDQLGIDPFTKGTKRLRGATDEYRIRVGDYRVIYRVDGKRAIVLVLKIGHRREIYR